MSALLSDPDLAAAIAGRRAAYAQKPIRLQYGETMLRLAARLPEFLVLTADLMVATGMAAFGAAYPDRLLNLGIAEQNMAGVAAGLALCGKLPVVCGYAAFTSLRALEQVKLDAAYNGVKVVFTAQSAGLSYGVGGPTHQTFEDVAIMRAIPNMVVLVPSDAAEVDACLEAAIRHTASAPIYVRLGRGPEYCFNPHRMSFRLGEAVPLRDGGDVSILATGAMVFEALLAADYLATRGIGASVLNIHTVKPIDRKAIIAAAQHVAAMLVVEEHGTSGGLGAAVLEVLSEHRAVPLRLIGIPDAFPPVGPTPQLRAALGLSAENIVLNALDLLRQPALPHRMARA